MHKNKTYNIFKICKTLTLDYVKGAKVPIDFSCKKNLTQIPPYLLKVVKFCE